MRLSDIADPAADALRRAGARVSDLAVPTVRLGVTGLSRAGKTVFITALVRNLTTGGRLPFFAAAAEGRIIAAYLEPQPDDSVPRFAYEDHLAALAADPPRWPDGTRRVSQLRITLEYVPTSRIRRALDARLGPSRLHIDIVDYPGEWLADLAMLEQTFAAWSAQTLAALDVPGRQPAAAEFCAFVAGLAVPQADGAEQTAIDGARMFTRALAAERAAAPDLASLGPGRFLIPGDLQGSPLLTFFPRREGTGGKPDAVTALLARRFESYKVHVVKPFFRDHFSRIDRQIVLVDALGALDAGPQGLADLSRALDGALTAFRPAANSWLSSIFRRRLDRVVFAATKADHLNRDSHDRLETLLRALIDRSAARAERAGAAVDVIAIAALRATREATVRRGTEPLPCIVGTPLAGQRVGTTVFDGRTETAFFPGDLPVDPKALLDGTGVAQAAGRDVRVLAFCPPRIVLETGAGAHPPLPHIRLDRAIEALIGDRLR